MKWRLPYSSSSSSLLLFFPVSEKIAISSLHRVAIPFSSSSSSFTSSTISTIALPFEDIRTPFFSRGMEETSVLSRIRAIDIGCGTGESTDFLFHSIQNRWFPSIRPHAQIEMVGMDTDVSKIKKASRSFPHYEFMYYNFYRSTISLSTRHQVHIVQTSLQELQQQGSNMEQALSKIQFVLKPGGLISLYGYSSESMSLLLKESDAGMDCLFHERSPIDASLQYIVVQPGDSEIFVDALLHFLQKLPPIQSDS